MNKNIHRCPFCGNDDAPILDYYQEEYDDAIVDGWFVVCDFQNKGCGASGGARMTKEQAIDAWNCRFFH